MYSITAANPDLGAQLQATYKYAQRILKQKPIAAYVSHVTDPKPETAHTNLNSTLQGNPA